MEFRTNRTAPSHGELQSQAFRSVSQHALSGDHQKTSSLGLRKLAATIRGTARTVEHERFRSTSREKQTLVDPRFRRERTRSPKKPTQSRSESQFTPNHEKTNTHSSTPAINKTSTFPKTPEPPPPKQQQPIAQVEVEVRKIHQHSSDEKKEQHEVSPMNVEMQQQQQKEQEEEEEEEMTNERDALVSVSLENHVNSLVKSLLSNEDEEEDEEERRQEVSARNKNNPGKDDSVVSSKSSVSSKRRRNSWGGNQTRNTFNENPRILKKYAYLLARGPKPTNSVENLTYQAQPKRNKPAPPPRDRCPCFNCNATTIEFNPEDVLKEHFKMPVMFLAGSGIAVVLMAFIAWILSNDFIWNLVNNGFNRESEQRNTVGYILLTYIGGAILCTINLIFGSLYYLFVLPRNAVYKIADEPWSPWQYINLK